MTCTTSINWGDVPTWIGAITTTLALIAAGWVVWIEMRRDDRADTERRRVEEDRARGEQATLVATWPDATRGSPALLVRNGSNLPIYSVEVWLKRLDNGRRIHAGTRSIVPPGDHWWNYPTEIYEVDDLGDGIVDETYAWVPGLSFEDSAGRLWERDENGVLDIIV